MLPTWLKYLILDKLMQVLGRYDATELNDWMETSLCRFNYLSIMRSSWIKKEFMPIKSIARSLGPGRGVRKRPFFTMARLIGRIHAWQRRIYASVEKLAATTSNDTKANLISSCLHPYRTFSVEMVAQFEVPDKYELLRNYLDCDGNLYLFYKYNVEDLSHLISSNASTTDDILLDGVELFRVKEPVNSFSFNSCSANIMTIITNNAKFPKKDAIREIDIEKSLRCLDRINPGLRLEKENPDTYAETLHQY